MKATRAIVANQTLTSKISEAVAEALTIGMSKDEVLAVLAQITSILENADD